MNNESLFHYDNELKIYAIPISNLPLGAFGTVNPRDNSPVQLP